VREVRNIESYKEDTDEAEDEQVQESEGEDCGLDTNKRIHPVRGSMYWLNI
jgi:hypothetical protein